MNINNTSPLDYSNKANWYQIPEITKEFDTFFIYPTEYIGSNEGDPDFADEDDEESSATATPPVLRTRTSPATWWSRP